MLVLLLLLQALTRAKACPHRNRQTQQTLALQLQSPRLV
jgi:hypothetical protein